DRNRNLAGLMESLTHTLSNMDSLLADSNASAENLVQAQKSYAEQLSRIKQTNPELGVKLESAPTRQTQIEIMSREQQKLTHQNAFGSGIQTLLTNANARSFVGSQSVFGLSPFGGTPQEAQKNSETFRNVAQESLGLMPQALKDALLNVPRENIPSAI